MSPVIRHCPACNTELMCHDDTDAGACWCRNYPALMPVDADADCLCEACLVKAIRQRIQDMMDVNDTGRMVEIAGRYRHSATLTESIDYTIEQGSFVFSHRLEKVWIGSKGKLIL